MDTPYYRYPTDPQRKSTQLVAIMVKTQTNDTTKDTADIETETGTKTCKMVTVTKTSELGYGSLLRLHHTRP